MTGDRSLQDVVAVRRRFARSANVERDAGGDGVSGYLPTARALDVISRIAAGLIGPSAGRAVSVTGPYGSGKSSLALFLDALLGPAVDRARHVARSALAGADAALAERLDEARTVVGAEPAGFIRAVVAAQREPVVATVLRALRSGVIRYAGGVSAARAVPGFREALSAEPGAVRTAADLRRVVGAAAAVAPVLLVLAEFGKNLEHAAGADADGADDLFVLQDLAEWASGTIALPLLVVTLQHLAFEEYAAGAALARRREWSKVLGRFVDLPYVDTPAQTQALIASVFERTEEVDVARPVDAWAAGALAEADAGGLRAALHVEPFACYPLHPVTVVALPELCARYGQNERTLFSFLAGPESQAVPAYLAGTRWPARGDLPSVRLDRVYDYFLESASTTVGAASTASRWLEIETRIRDAQGLAPAEQRILKSVGVLNLVSAGGALRASRRLVVASVADGRPGTEAPPAVEAAIERLEAAGLLTYRDFADELRVWSGTDFDLKGAVELARRRVREVSVASLLGRVRPLAPVVAARHSQQTGTLRVFERRFADGRSAGVTALPANTSADGLVLLCVDPEGQLPRVAAADGDKPIILGLSRRATKLADTARELAAYLDVLDTAADLEGDWVARRELRERAAAAARSLDVALEQAFGLANRGVRWIPASGASELDTSGGLSSALSSLCDRLYPGTPEIRNEMLARRDLTSQGAKARGDLLEAMVERGGEARLGLEGYGPERAMYEAVLRRPGIHRFVAGTWRFVSPAVADELNFLPCWSAMETAFEEAVDQPIVLSELFERLMAPPWGLKQGPIPVLVTAALLARADDVAVYEEGTFVARLTADVVERLAKNPDRFAFKSYATRGQRGQVAAALAQALGVTPRASSKGRVSSVVAVVSPLLARARSLTPYAQRTRRASPVALAVRTALFDAREPDDLLFDALPSALGFEPVPARGALPAGATRSYPDALATAISELESLHGAQLDHIEGAVAGFLGAQTASVRSDARIRAERLAGQILEPQLRSFALALADQHLEQEEWLAYVGMVVANAPVASWTDDDCDRFDQRLRQVGAAFRRVEALHFAQAPVPEDGFRAVRVTLTRGDGSDSSRVVWVDESAQGAVDAVLEDALARAMTVLGQQGREMLLATLAERVLLHDESGAVAPGPRAQTQGEERCHG